MEQEVYLLYEGDEWLSTGSLVLMGIFTSQELLKCNAKKLIRERGKKHLKFALDSMMYMGNELNGTIEENIEVVVEDILEELLFRGATSGWEVNYCYTSATLNELGEI